MIAYLTSFLGYKERSIGMFILVLFSCSVNAQTITGLSEIYVDNKALLFVKNQNVEAYQKKENDSIIEKGKIYVSKGTLVHNLDSESIQIIETKQKSTKKTNNYVVSKSGLKSKVAARKAMPQQAANVVQKINIKPANSESLFFFQIGRNLAIALPVQNFQQKQIAVIKNSYHREFLQKETLVENSFYENPTSYSYNTHSSFSVRPPPVV